MRNQILRSYEKSVKNEGTELNELFERKKQEIVRLLMSTGDSNAEESVALPLPSYVSDHFTHMTKGTCDKRESEVNHSQSATQKLESESRVVIEEFVKEFRKYIREWIGPTASDAVKFADFFTSFAEENLEVTQIILRFFHRLVLQLDRKGWALYFNTLLAQVQEVTKQCFGGTLKIAELDV